MFKEWNDTNAIHLLEIGASNIKNFEEHFVAYNNRYLGFNVCNNFEIKGKSIKGSKYLNEFCYGYDGEYHQLHLLHVYEMIDGTKFATTEISNNVYAFWEILD